MSSWVVALRLAFASPEQSPIDLAWDAPTECPDAAELLRRTQRLLHAAGRPDAGVGLRARGIVQRNVDGFTLELTLEGSTGAATRRVVDTDCEKLTDAAALIVSIAIDPATVLRADLVPPPPPQTPPPEPIEPHLADPAVHDVDATDVDPPVAQTGGRASARGTPAIALALRAGLGADAITWRPVGLSLGVGAAIVGPGFRVGLVGRYAAPSEVSAASNTAVRARVQQWSVGADACGVPTFGRKRTLELPLCAGIEGGAMHARGRGDAVVGRRSRVPWLAMTAGPTLMWRFTPRLVAWIGADAIVLVGRGSFVTDRGTQVLQPRRIGLRALAGIEVRLPGARR